MIMSCGVYGVCVSLLLCESYYTDIQDFIPSPAKIDTNHHRVPQYSQYQRMGSTIHMNYKIKNKERQEDHDVCREKERCS